MASKSTQSSGTKVAGRSRKVKTGCRTCKTRKVKCDETWPICLRCQSTGRKCDGYGIRGGGSDMAQLDKYGKTGRENIIRACTNYTATTLQPSITWIMFRTSEKECFEWYVHRSATKLHGVFPSEYWTTLLLQASMTEPAIRHALLTLSSAHKEEVAGADALKRTSHNQQSLFTMTQYSKAISSLRSSLIDKEITSMRVALISCVLFISAEFLRGHYSSGISHFESGLRLLRYALEDEVANHEPWTSNIDGWLITMFTRYFVQAKLLGQTSVFCGKSWFNLGGKSKLNRFRSIHHARRDLEYIMLQAFDIQQHIIQSTKADSQNELLDASLKDHQQEIQGSLDTWYRVYQATQGYLPSYTHYRDRFAYDLLRVYYQLARILVATCSEPLNELAYDRHESDFASLVSHCTELQDFVHASVKADWRVGRDPEPSSPNSFSDMGWVAPLYFTAIKCRNHYLRHQAIHLISESPHREGIWSSTLAAKIAKELVDSEEGDFYKNKNVDVIRQNSTKASTNTSAMPTLPVESRLRGVKVILPDERFGDLLLCYHRVSHDGMFEGFSKCYSLHSGRWSNQYESFEDQSDCFESFQGTDPGSGYFGTDMLRF